LLHVGVSCKYLASHVLVKWSKEMEIIGYGEIATVGRVVHNVPAVRTVKVKCTLVQALRLCTGCTAHRGSRGIALPFLDHGTRRG